MYLIDCLNDLCTDLSQHSNNNFILIFTKRKRKQIIKIVFSVTLTGDTFESYYKRFGFMYDDFHQKVFN